MHNAERFKINAFQCFWSDNLSKEIFTNANFQSQQIHNRLLNCVSCRHRNLYIGDTYFYRPICTPIRAEHKTRINGARNLSDILTFVTTQIQNGVVARHAWCRADDVTSACTAEEKSINNLIRHIWTKAR